MDSAGVDIYVLFASVEVPCKFQNVFLSQTVKMVNFYTFPESRHMLTLFLQCYSVRRAYTEPQTCNLIRLKLQLNVIHFQICCFHKGSLLFPATMTSLHPGPCYSINSGHFGSFFPVTFRPLLQTHQNFRLYSFQTMASKFPEDQGSDLSKHPAVTTYVAPPVTKPLLASLNIPPVPE